MFVTEITEIGARAQRRKPPLGDLRPELSVLCDQMNFS